MENKVLELIEKVYIELKDFKKEMYEFRTEMLGFKDDMLGFKDDMLGFKDDMLGFKDDMVGFKGEMLDFRTETNKRFTKLEINQELTNDKLSEAYEAISSLAESNQIEHQEIMKELKGDLKIVELAVKRIAK